MAIICENPGLNNEVMIFYFNEIIHFLQLKLPVVRKMFPNLDRYRP